MEATALAQRLQDCGLESFCPLAAPAFLDSLRHGDLPRWRQALAELPALNPSTVNLQDGVTVGRRSDCSDAQWETLARVARGFIPWRKGPFRLFDLCIDSEWQSQLKWNRVLPHLAPVAGRRVLDVGCGNGYYSLRLCGQGARLVIGAEPYLPYVMQFLIVEKYLPAQPCQVLPVGLEQLPVAHAGFDTVLSMGVLYHVRTPIDHLRCLFAQLCSGGQLLLETLVVDGDKGDCLIPAARYARMPNVYNVPSCATALDWLGASGFMDARLVDLNTTTTVEQRQTPWMPFDSLPQALDPHNPDLTIEGLPAPQRAIFVARKP